MTQVCLVGSDAVNLRYELLSRETARDALATYDLREPFDNTVAVETVSLGSAVALLNDLNWYLVRYADDTMVRDPSISDEEWLSRALAAAVRDDDIAPEDSNRFLKIYGIERPSTDEPSGGEHEASDGGDEVQQEDGEAAADSPPRLVEPMYVTRTGPDLPAYDLREVDDTLVVRVTEDEFGGEKQR